MNPFMNGLTLSYDMAEEAFVGIVALGEGPLPDDCVMVADKPAGWTSHDVVHFVKKMTGAGKVGHLGTLDPMATGVLPLVINGATRFSRFLDAGPKSYQAQMKLGEETDTYDREGRVVRTSEIPRLTKRDMEDAFSNFRGRITQVPPMYSSIKVAGTPLYKLARKGVTVERAPRQIEVFSINIISVDIPHVEFSVVCSKGTYVRSISSDIGRALGCGAHLTGLRRTGSGAFTIDEAINPMMPSSGLRGSLIPLEKAIARASVFFRELEVDPDQAAAIEASKAAGSPLEGPLWERFFPFLKYQEVVRFTHMERPIALAEYALYNNGDRKTFKIVRRPSGGKALFSL